MELHRVVQQRHAALGQIRMRQFAVAAAASAAVLAVAALLVGTTDSGRSALQALCPSVYCGGGYGVAYGTAPGAAYAAANYGVATGLGGPLGGGPRCRWRAWLRATRNVWPRTPMRCSGCTSTPTQGYSPQTRCSCASRTKCRLRRARGALCPWSFQQRTTECLAFWPMASAPPSPTLTRHLQQPQQPLRLGDALAVSQRRSKRPNRQGRQPQEQSRPRKPR